MLADVAGSILACLPPVPRTREHAVWKCLPYMATGRVGAPSTCSQPLMACMHAAIETGTFAEFEADFHAKQALGDIEPVG